MPKTDVKYFSVRKTDGVEIYFAAKDEQSVLRHYRSNPFQMSESIREIPEEEAKKAKWFEFFAEDYSLCPDGTWMLGKPQN